MDLKQLRREILEKVRAFGKAAGRERFVPGVSYVNYAGRVYDGAELVNLVDSSLDFWLTAGRYAAAFEKQFAQWIGVSYCLLTNSGSSANLLAVSALTSPFLRKRRLTPGDEVITTACGFPTTINPIIQNNLVPVFVDVEPGTYNIDVSKIGAAITKKTKALVVAHTLGNPAEMDRLLKIVKRHKLWLIEDNCDALGANYRGKHTGTFGHIATCSFYPAHHITMGEGGAVLTSDPLLRRIVLSFRDWGRDCWCLPGSDNTCGKRFSRRFPGLPPGYDHKYVYSHIGYNLKVTDMQAAVGLAQLGKLPRFIKKRRENFAFLHRGLKRQERYLRLPHATKNSEPSWFGFPILVREDAPFTRGEMVNYLEDKRIATRMLFGGNLTRQPAYAASHYRVAGGLQVTDQVMKRLFWIGVYPGITREKLSFVVKTIAAFIDRYRA
ncbi:MAG: lipopolysaccharide biosynthesis protein RfbH [Candidatus Aureabacteria bacterium]|nr:lipopolysaccharide biosynthesis protein RfbH [Candidatus Auribacterota bacterium]